VIHGMTKKVGFGPGPSADPLTRFQNDHGPPGREQRSGGSKAGSTGTDHQDIDIVHEA